MTNFEVSCELAADMEGFQLVDREDSLLDMSLEKISELTSQISAPTPNMERFLTLTRQRSRSPPEELDITDARQYTPTIPLSESALQQLADELRTRSLTPETGEFPVAPEEASSSSSEELTCPRTPSPPLSTGSLETVSLKTPSPPRVGSNDEQTEEHTGAFAWRPTRPVNPLPPIAEENDDPMDWEPSSPSSSSSSSSSSSDDEQPDNDEYTDWISVEPEFETSLDAIINAHFVEKAKPVTQSPLPKPRQRRFRRSNLAPRDRDPEHGGLAMRIAAAQNLHAIHFQERCMALAEKSGGSPYDYIGEVTACLFEGLTPSGGGTYALPSL